MEKVVLIIDDSPTFRRIASFNFKSIQGFKKHLEANDGKEGLDLLHSNKVDLILLDLNMPVMDGFEFLKAKQEVGDLKDIPVIMLTTEGDVKNREKAKELGATGFLTKPFNSMQLKQSLKSIFG